jgi:hypothetical protein
VEGYTFLEKSVYPGVKKLVYTPSGVEKSLYTLLWGG